MPFNSSLRYFGSRRNGGACPPALNATWIPVGLLGLPNWRLGRTHSLRMCAQALSQELKNSSCGTVAKVLAVIFG